MKKIHATVALVCALILIICILYAVKVAGEAGTVSQPSIATSTSPITVPTDRQEIWINALEWCESQGIPTAINPKDTDNTPSYGILQFKPGTYAYFAKAYGMASTTNYMDPLGQKKIVENMLFDPTVNWQKQFPDCVHRLGTPPKK